MSKRRDKQKRCLELSQFPNVFEYNHISPEILKGKWQNVFQNQNPLILELACGKGEYTLELARRYPQKNFIGIDIKGPRLWKGAREALENKLENVRFVRMYIDHLSDFFAPKEISQIWITFADPHPTKKGIKKRITNPRFLSLYKEILIRGGIIHLKTDSDILFCYTKEVLQELSIKPKTIIENIDMAHRVADLDICTYYESVHRELGEPIHYLSFSFDTEH